MKNGDYSLMLAPKDYPGNKYRGKYAYTHAVMYWKWTGKVAEKGELIHFIDGDRKNVTVHNLEIVSLAEHTRLHNFERKARTVRLRCSWCGHLIVREKRQDRYIKAYCNRRCMGAAQGRENQSKRIK